MAEHYYFGPDGYMISDTAAPDGQQVSEEGAWILDGVIPRRWSKTGAGVKACSAKFFTEEEK